MHPIQELEPVVSEQEAVQMEALAIQELPPALIMIPLQELVHEPDDGPRWSIRLAKKLQGMYIHAVEKAMKKEKREASTISSTSKSSK
jgi:hypothetical protein